MHLFYIDVVMPGLTLVKLNNVFKGTREIGFVQSSTLLRLTKMKTAKNEIAVSR